MHRRIWMVLAAFAAAQLAAQLPGCRLLGAPVPKQTAPKELVNKDLLGDWTMKWGSVDGTASFGTDGYYYEVYGGSHYIGYWYIEGAAVVIVERWFDPATGATGSEMTFRFKSAERRPGYFRGATDSGTVLLLTRP
jgi:hypothetical protein